MKHSLRFKVVTACYTCYLAGSFLGELFLMQSNKVALVLMVMIPTIVVLAYISMAVHSVQPRKKSMPAMQVAPVVRRKSRK